MQAALPHATSASCRAARAPGGPTEGFDRRAATYRAGHRCWAHRDRVRHLRTTRRSAGFWALGLHETSDRTEPSAARGCTPPESETQSFLAQDELGAAEAGWRPSGVPWRAAPSPRRQRRPRDPGSLLKVVQPPAQRLHCPADSQDAARGRAARWTWVRPATRALHHGRAPSPTSFSGGRGLRLVVLGKGMGETSDQSVSPMPVVSPRTCQGLHQAGLSAVPGRCQFRLIAISFERSGTPATLTRRRSSLRSSGVMRVYTELLPTPA